MIKKKNNILYYSYDKTVKEDINNFFSNKLDCSKFKSTKEVIDILDLYYSLYNRFNKYGITMNKLNNFEEIKYCDEIYAKFEEYYNDIINNAREKIGIESFYNTKYYSLIENYDKLVPNTSKMNKIYFEFNNSTVPLDFPFEKIIGYVDSREQEIRKNGYKSYLDYVKHKVCINDDAYHILIDNFSNIKKKEQDDEKTYLFSLSEAKKKIISILSEFYDVDIIEILLNNTYLSTTRSGTTVAYGELPIINIYSTDEKVDIVILAHELGHAYHYYCNSKNEIQNFDSRADFSEAFAIATQLIVSNSLRLNNRILRDYENFFYDTIYSLKIQTFIGENYNSLTEESIEKEFNDYKNYYRYILDNFYDLYYLICFVVGNIIYVQISNNKYSKEKLKILLSFNSNMSLDKILYSFDIDVNNIEQLKLILNKINLDYRTFVS